LRTVLHANSSDLHSVSGDYQSNYSHVESLRNDGRIWGARKKRTAKRIPIPFPRRIAIIT